MVLTEFLNSTSLHSFPVSNLKYVEIIDDRNKIYAGVDNLISNLNVKRVLVFAGSTGMSIAKNEIRALREISPSLKIVLVDKTNYFNIISNAELWFGYNAVIGIGGGTLLDVAKYVASVIQVPYVAIPTLISHDGICSPVAVLKDKNKNSYSMGACMPVGIVIDMDIISKVPFESIQAGLGDLFGNVTALVDWKLSHEEMGEPIDNLAYYLSETASHSLLYCQIDKTRLRKPEFLRRLVKNLIISGLAMEIAGTSRPCSGAEHLISHSLDKLYNLNRYHGEQVAYGSIIATYFQGGDWRNLIKRYRMIGLPVLCADFGLKYCEMSVAVSNAPKTRPKRFTILSKIDLEKKFLERVFMEIEAEYDK